MAGRDGTLRRPNPFARCVLLYSSAAYDVSAIKSRTRRPLALHGPQGEGVRLPDRFGRRRDERAPRSYIWGWESYEERTQKNAAWRADPERAKKWAETEKDGPLVNRVYNQLMEPTSYSQLDRGEAYGPDAATRSPYIFELREYQAMPGKITNITDRFGNFTCDAFKKHGFRQVGYWHNRMGGNDHQLTYLLAWESLTSAWPSSTRSPRTTNGPCLRREREEGPSCSRWPTRVASHGLLPDEGGGALGLRRQSAVAGEDRRGALPPFRVSYRGASTGTLRGLRDVWQSGVAFRRGGRRCAD